MRKRIALLGVLAAGTAATGVVAAATATTTSAPFAGCTTSYVGSTTANSSNLPSPYIHPPIVGVNLGNPTGFAGNQKAYTTTFVSCVVADPAGGV